MAGCAKVLTGIVEMSILGIFEFTWTPDDTGIILLETKFYVVIVGVVCKNAEFWLFVTPDDKESKLEEI